MQKHRLTCGGTGAEPAVAEVGGSVEHLFRHESGRIVSYLTRLLGPEHMDLAEEVVQEALLKALQSWSYSGIPSNPAAWLLQVARNSALDAIRHRKVSADKEPALIAELTAASRPLRPDFDLIRREAARRRTAHDLHVLSSRAFVRGQRRTQPESDRRLQRARNCPRVSCRRSHHRAASGAGQAADPRERRCRSICPADSNSTAASTQSSTSSTSCSTRATTRIRAKS